MGDLKGKFGLIVGLANESSIAYGVAKQAVAAGAQILVTYVNEKAGRYVVPLANELRASSCALDFSNPADMDRLQMVLGRYPKLDFVVHSAAFCPMTDLKGRVIDCSADGFAKMMDLSVHSFLRLVNATESYLERDAAVIAMSYIGSQRAVPGYGVIGMAKGALESAVRYVADELAFRGVHAHVVSPGPIRTRAASGLREFGELHDTAAQRSILGRAVTIEEVGDTCAFLVEHGAPLTGQTTYVDGGFHVAF